MNENTGMKLSFSTLACPGWDWETVIGKAKEYGYGGIEIRGLQDELEIERLSVFQENRIEETSARLKDAGLFMTCIDTSCDILGDADIGRTLQSGRAAIEIAARLGAPYIRVFGDEIPQDMPEGEAVKAVAGALRQLGKYAEELGVHVLLETHGSFASSSLPLEALELANCPSARILWDAANTYGAGETPGFTWQRIGCMVRHVHIKDYKNRNGELVHCLPGQGAVPIGEILRTLRQGGYDGWLSLEWEKRWDPSIDDPEVALPAFVNYMSQMDWRTDAR